MFDLSEGRFFGGPVRGADGVSALERNVFEHVGEAGLALWVVDRADVDVGVEGNDRRVVAFENNEVETVRQRELGNALFEGLEILRGDGDAEGKKEGDGGEAVLGQIHGLDSI